MANENLFDPPPANDPPLNDHEAGEDLEAEILAEYIDRLTKGESLHPELILAAHPTMGPEIIEQLEAFQGFGGHNTNTPLGTLGDYTLRRQIGRGGMGVVYEAWQGSMDRIVALKVLPPGVAADNKAFVRFLREAKTAGQLNHPNVVPVYSTGVEEGTPWYAMLTGQSPRRSLRS
jgi:hypothetical protein